jgi:hypothetical protein
MDKIKSLKEQIKRIDWDSVSDDWIIEYRPRKNASVRRIFLDPYSDCTPENPLYLHKQWLERLYYDNELNLNYSLLSKLCNFKNRGIEYWFSKFNIPKKSTQRLSSSGYITCIMPETYKHPQIKPQPSGKTLLHKHRYIMELYLRDHPNLEISKKALLNGLYLRSNCVVHHINFIKTDIRLKNLWLYLNRSEHGYVYKILNNRFRDLIKLGQINFDNGKYFLNSSFDYRSLVCSTFDKLTIPTEFVSFADLNLVKEQIKKIDWSKISNDWIVKHKANQCAPIKKIFLDPYSDCTPKNPLYRHKCWVESIVNDKRLNLTDLRLAELCNISETTAYRWRWKTHKIPTYNNRWGKYRYMTKHNSKGNHIWIKLPKDCKNPFAKKKARNNVMLEHRYIMELYLRDHPNLEISKRALLNGLYLKSNFIVHHINLDTLDNRLENLWLCKNRTNHNSVHRSLLKLVDSLLKFKFLIFDNGIYQLNY